MNFLVTGGAGFIGSAVIRYLINNTSHNVLNLDKLTYAANLGSLISVSDNPNYSFVHGDICDTALVQQLLSDFEPHVVMHLAAESHVDRSIDGPQKFIETNIVGTSALLECTLKYWMNLTQEKKLAFRFHHISTDEVYGSLSNSGLFSETTAYDPSSPYAASKASSDHLVRAWHRTYQLPVLITNCSNNYGPYQFPEKLIPLIILNALDEKPLPIYGNGSQIRDWLHVEDHAHGLYEVVTKAKPGETYNIGGHNERTNLSVVETICEILDNVEPKRTKSIRSYKDLITFVTDRPGHDQRYAIDASKITRELHWQPKKSFATGIHSTVQWYLKNREWCNSTQSSGYKRERLGVTN